MSKKWLISMMATAMVFTLGLATGCFNVEPSNSSISSTAPVSGTITLSAKTAQVDVYDTLQLTATKEGLDGDIVWSSSNEAIATVDQNGLVSALSAGTVTITAAVGEVKATCEVTASVSDVAPIMTVSSKNVQVIKGESFDVTVSTTWKGKEVTSAQYSWYLQNEDEGTSDIVSISVSADGKTATFTGLAHGTETYCVSTFVNGRAWMETVTVVSIDNSITMEVSNLMLGNQGYEAQIALAESNGHATSVTPNVVVYYQGAPQADAQITWTTDDEDIAAIDENGVITGLKPGVATFQAMAMIDGHVALLNVRVQVYSLQFEYAVENAIDVDLNGAANASLALGEIAGKLGGTLASATIGETTFATASCADGNIIVDKASIGNVYGDATITAVFQTMKGDVVAVVETVSIPVKLYRTISTAEEFLKLPDYVLVSAGVTQGDFRVTADINLDGATINGVGKYDGGWKDPFVGTFDGGNHTISNGVWSTDNSGLFSCIGQDGVVKNTNFVNIEHRKTQSGFVCSKLSTGGTIENVFVYGSFTENIGDSWTEVGMLAHQLAGGTIKNCLVVIESSSLTDHGGIFASFCTLNNGQVTNEIQDCAAINLSGNDLKVVGEKSVLIADEEEKSGITAYTSIAKYLEEVDETSEFGAWTVEILNTHVKSFEAAALEMSAEKTEVAKNGSTQITIANKAFLKEWSLKESVAGVTFDAETGIISASASAVEGKGAIVIVAKGALGTTKEIVFDIVKETIVSSLNKMEYDAFANANGATINLDVTATELRFVAVGGVQLEEGVATLSADGKQVVIPNDCLVDGETANNVVISVTDGDKIYEITVPVVKITRVISNVEELNWFAENSTADGKYYVLDSNISYTGTYAYVGKFGRSVLDGRGYVIDNFVTSTGLIGATAAANNATEIANTLVKNLVLTNAKTTIAGKGIIVDSYGFTVDNVYVSVAADALEGTCAIYRSCWANMRLKAVIVEYLGKQVSQFMGAFYNNTGSANGLYIVNAASLDNGNTSNDRVNTANNYIADILGVYASWNDFDKNADFSMFNDVVWTKVNGVPVPKNLTIPAIYNTETDVLIDSEYTIKASGYSIITISALDGVTLSDRVITVANSVAGGQTITITVTNALDSSQSVTLTLTTKANTTIEVEDTVDYDVATELTVANLTNRALTNVAVTLNGNTVANATFADGTLSVPANTLAKGLDDWGAITLVVSGDDNTGRVTINVPVYAYKAIRTFEDLDGIEAASVKADLQLYGYFKLMDDIDMTNKTWQGNTWYAGSAWTAEWWGVFDGNNHAIYNWTLSTDGKGANAGLFSKIGTSGVVKNLAIINASVDSTGLIATQSNGTVDNVFVSGRIAAGKVNWAPATLLVGKHTGGAITNCMVIYDDVSDPASSYGGLIAGYTAAKVENNVVLNLSGKNWWMISKPDNAALFVANGSENANETLNKKWTSWSEYKENGTTTNTLAATYLPIVEKAGLTLSVDGAAEVAIGGSKQVSVAVSAFAASWSIVDGATGVSVEDGVVSVNSTATANTSFQVQVTGYYGETATLTLTIVMVTEEKEISDTISYDASVNDGAVVDLSSVVNSTLTKVRSVQVGDTLYSGDDVAALLNGNKVTVPNAWLVDGETANSVVISVTDDTMIYNVSLSVVKITKILYNADDLNWFAENSTQTKTSGVGKYYVLGGDIDYSESNSIYSMPDNWGSYNVLDGKGYTIYNFKTYNGLIGKGANGNAATLVAGTVVKNLSLVNATVNATGQYIIMNNGGATLQDIYVSVAADTPVDTYVFKSGYGSFTVKACIIEYLGDKATYMSGCIVNNWGNIKGLYVINANALDNNTTNDRQPSAGNYVADIAGVYADWNALAGADFSMFNEVMWDKTTYSVPVPKKLTLSTLINNTEEVVLSGSELSIITSAYCTVSINSIDGVTLSGKTISIAENVANGTEIEITVTNVATGDTAEKTITVKANITLNKSLDFDLRNDLVIDLTEWGISTLTSVTVNGSTADLTPEENELTLAKTMFGTTSTDWGTQKFVFIGESSTGSTVTVNADILAFKSIRNLDDMKNMPTDSYMSGTHAYGYFKMTDDINMTGIEWKGLGARGTETGNAWTFYWRGTFDGANHAVRNWVIPEGVRGGWIAYSGPEAVFKNIAFINVTANGNAVVTSNTCSTFENIVVSGSINTTGTSFAWSCTTMMCGTAIGGTSSLTIKDCFVVCNSIENASATYGAMLVGNKDTATFTVKDNVVINLSGLSLAYVSNAQKLDKCANFEQADATLNKTYTSWEDYDNNGTTTNTLAAKYIAEIRNTQA